MERFYVQRKDDAYKIVDREHKQWNLPEMAVSIHFKYPHDADNICKVLNREWNRFLSNPE